MRHLKILTLCLFSGVIFITLSLWTKCGSELTTYKTFKEETVPVNAQIKSKEVLLGEEIDCVINGEYTVPCKREADEVYIPFSFIHKYFDIYGKIASYNGYERFEWSHAYSKIYEPRGRYDPTGVFMYFENYNVEVRDRVKCISASQGVPVSTQWEAGGYFYPTQIAQFGLSHYSKNITEGLRQSVVLEDGYEVQAPWQGHVTRASGILSFFSIGGNPIELKVDRNSDIVLSVDLLLRPSDNSSLSVVLINREKDEVWRLHYNCSSTHIYAKDHDVYHGMDCNGHSWNHLTRDLLIDLQKGLSIQGKPKKKLFRSKFKVWSVLLEGWGKLDNLTLGWSGHSSQFYSAAKWFVKNQDPVTGAWPIPVRRKVVQGMKDLKPGWVSAMGQGHGISVLARAYYISRWEGYLEAASRALRPFSTPSSAGGVLTKFFNSLPWYEEYPTQPSSFVLNGFIYSLIGLYDLKSVAPEKEAREADFLFQQGMTSLKKLLPLFDNGSGSNYDLRHVTIGCAPNIARWDYHATHINQLLLLATIDSDPILSRTARRWINYMNGKRAPHN